VKYVLIGAGECRPIVFHDRRAGASQLRELTPIGGRCAFRNVRSVRVLTARPTVGVVVAGTEGTAFVVPSFDFQVHVTPSNRSTTPTTSPSPRSATPPSRGWRGTD
jgi:hypothetical protein